MATEITTTNEFWVELSDESGEYTRTLRIENPDTSTYTTKASVEAVLKPHLFPTNNAEGAGEIVPLFYDDADPSVGLTKIKSVEHVNIVKQVRRYE